MSNDTVKILQEVLKESLKYIIYISIAGLIAIPTLLSTQAYTIGKLAGVLAVIAFVVTQIPGLIRRFGLTGIFRDLYKILFASRAQQGIAMFFFGLIHYMNVYTLPVAVPIIEAGGTPSIELYTFIGLMALLITFLLAITSNMQSKRLLKKWWHRLHKLVFILSWAIAVHLILVVDIQLRENPTSIILAGTVVILILLQIVSLLFAQIKRSKKNT